MKVALRFGLCLAVIAAPLSTASMAKAPANFVSAQAHQVAGGRAIRVMVAQSEIKADINPSNLAVATGGGMLGGLLAAAQNAARTKKAEAALEPVRTALADFDADTLSLETTRRGLASVDWLQPVDPAFSKDSSLLGKSAALDAGAAAQIAFIEYSFDMSPDFSSVRVVAKLEFANKMVPTASAAKPESRLFPKNLAYAQKITSIVTLPAPSTDMQTNATLWASDSAKMARQALNQAFRQIDTLLPRTLALTDADVQAMNAKDKPKGVAGGFGGRIQASASSGTLLWSDGFILIQPLS